MAFSIRDVALIAPFQLSTLSMFPAVMYAQDFPEHSDIVAWPATGMIVGAVILGVAYFRAVRRDRKDELQLSSEAESFLAGGAV